MRAFEELPPSLELWPSKDLIEWRAYFKGAYRKPEHTPSEQRAGEWWDEQMRDVLIARFVQAVENSPEVAALIEKSENDRGR